MIAFTLIALLMYLSASISLISFVQLVIIITIITAYRYATALVRINPLYLHIFTRKPHISISQVLFFFTTITISSRLQILFLSTELTFSFYLYFCRYIYWITCGWKGDTITTRPSGLIPILLSSSLKYNFY